MGLAERFKEKLKEKDIFNNETEKSEKIYITPPCSNNTNKKDLTSVENNPTYESNNEDKNIEDLESEIIAKIRKTPYWEEYSHDRQLKMISAYFDKKTMNKVYNQELQITMNKDKFIKDILTLANNR